MANPLEVGRKIYYTGDMANPSGTGCISAVTPIANPLKSYSLGTGRMVENDNSVRYDVVLNDGRMMKQLPAFLFDPQTCGQRFQPRDGTETADEVAAMLDNANVYEATKKAEATAKANAFERAKANAKAEGLALGLTPEAEFKGRGTAAASNLRRELKAAGIPVLSLRGDYNSVNVKVAIGATTEQYAKAKAIAAKYKAGNFDGMTDCYEFNPSAWGSVFGDVQYVFIEQDRDWSKVAA